MVTIIFEAHGTTTDNETHRSSGWFDVALSSLGEEQARELGRRYRERTIDAVYCSDLQRARRTAELAFNGRALPILCDARLRECDYGELTQHPSGEVDREKPHRISVPFPGGESYEQCAVRVRAFLEELLRERDGQTVMIIGHRATQYGLDRWVLGVPLAEAVAKTFVWQPGWEYHLDRSADEP